MNEGSGDAASAVPDQTSKPSLAPEAVPALVQHVFGFHVTGVKQLNGYDDINFHIKVDTKHTNQHVKSVNPDGYTLKVLNSVESKQPAIVESQHQIIWTLKKDGFSVPCPVPNENGEEWTLVTLRKALGPHWQPQNADDPSSKHIVRLLEFVPGQLLHSVPYTAELMVEIGECVGRLTNCLQDVWHPIYATADSNWYMRSIPRVADYTWVVEDPVRRKMAEDVVQRFKELIVPQMSDLPQGCLHGDLNEQNLLVREDPDQPGRHRLCGILDFGDSHHSAVVFELALAIMYLMVESEIVPRADVGGYILAGYSRHRRLNEREMEVLKTAVCGRFTQSLVLGAHAHYQNPTNSYVLVTARNGWRALQAIWEVPQDQLYQRWQQIVDSCNNA